MRLEAPALMAPLGTSGLRLRDEINDAVLDRSAIEGRRGYDVNARFRTLDVGASGRATIEGEELDRFEVRLGGDGWRSARYAGYMRVGRDLAPLPIGSHLDPSTGVFTWHPGVGFVHNYDLVFVQCVSASACVRRELRIVLHPKQSNRVGPQVVIDLPRGVRLQPDSPIVQPFVVAGWAIDVDDGVGTGIDTLHVWAYPRATSLPAEAQRAKVGDAPIFLGATSYGGARPDVAAIFGERFKNSGFGLTVDALPPGTYDLAVFAWSTVNMGFVPARTVRVTVR